MFYSFQAYFASGQAVYDQFLYESYKKFVYLCDASSAVVTVR